MEAREMAKIKFWSVGVEGHGGYLERNFDNVVEMLREMQSGDDPYMVRLPSGSSREGSGK